MKQYLQSLVSAALLILCSGCIWTTASEDRTVYYPRLEEIAAGCDSQDWWDIWAQVSHPEGVHEVSWVWVEVSYVSYDDYDDMWLEYIDDIPLEYVYDGEWGIFVSPDDHVLDCHYPFEYHFRFVAEDESGNRDSGELIN